MEHGEFHWQWMNPAGLLLILSFLKSSLCCVILQHDTHLIPKLENRKEKICLQLFPPLVIYTFENLTCSWRCQSSWSCSCPFWARGSWLLRTAASSLTEPFSFFFFFFFFSLIWATVAEAVGCGAQLASFLFLLFPILVLLSQFTAPTQEESQLLAAFTNKRLETGRCCAVSAVTWTHEEVG